MTSLTPVHLPIIVEIQTHRKKSPLRLNQFGATTKKMLARQLVGSWRKMLWAYSVINREVAAGISNQRQKRLANRFKEFLSHR
jgi:hypothetical protein